MDVLRKIVAGISGGFVGGALVGLGEAVVVAGWGGAEEFGVFSFAVLAYGLIGAAIGAGAAIASIALPFLARDGAAAAGLAGGTATALLALAITRFRVVRDVFAENLPIASRSGIEVHLGLLVAALVVFVVVSRLLRALARGRAGLLSSALAAVVLVVVGVAGSAVLNATAIKTAVVPAPATAKGPNAILIIADTLRADHVGAYGSTSTKTPGIDRLAKDGVVFEKAYAQSSWTRPSIATIMTSLYPASHKVMYKTDLLPDGVTTVAEAMRENGYRTVGYVTNINVAPSFHFDQGFQEYYYLAPEFFFGAGDSASKLALYSVMRLLRERFLSKEKFVQHYYQDAQTVNGAALPWIDRNSAQPFFTLIHYMDPHDPYFEIPYNGVAVARVDTPNPDPSQRDRLERLYASNVEYMDRFIGNLIEALKAANAYDNTMIVLVADHGEEFYEHKGWWHGTTLYDEETHVPFVVKLPKNAKAGTRVKSAAQLLDVAPTIVAACGGAALRCFQGRDLFSDAKAPLALYAQEDHEGNVLESVRNERWKMILANEGNPRGLAPVELYDMQADPVESRNLAGEQAEVVAGLKNDLEQLRAFARSGAVAGQSGALDDAAKERMRALGYLQ